MAVRTRTLGDKFSRREELALFDNRNSRADHRDTIAHWNSMRLWTLEGQLERIEGEANDILTHDQQVPLSFVDYATEAQWLIALVRQRLAEGDADAVGRHCLELGAIRREVQLKIACEHQAFASSEGGKEGARRRWPGEATKDRDAQIRIEFDALRGGGVPIMKAYKALGRKFKISARAVSRVITGK